MQLTFGKYKGSELAQVPTDYLEWGANKLDSPKWRKEFESELSRRNKEQKEKDIYIKANIDSQEVWEMLVKEAEKELYEEEDFSLENDCQYDGRVITQKEIDDLAKEKLAAYKAEIELEKIDAEFMKKWKVTQSQINEIQEAYWNDELERLCSNSDRYQAANELATKRSDLIEKIRAV